MQKLPLLLAAAALCCFACSKYATDKTNPVAAVAAARAAIEKANLNYGQRFFTNDPNFYESRYTADACVFSPNWPTVCGRDEVRKFFYNNGQNGDIKIKVVADEVFGSGENMTEIGKYEISNISGESVDKGKFVVAWRLENGVWKIYREIWNADLNDGG